MHFRPVLPPAGVDVMAPYWFALPPVKILCCRIGGVEYRVGPIPVWAHHWPVWPETGRWGKPTVVVPWNRVLLPPSIATIEPPLRRPVVWVRDVWFGGIVVFDLGGIVWVVLVDHLAWQLHLHHLGLRQNAAVALLSSAEAEPLPPDF